MVTESERFTGMAMLLPGWSATMLLSPVPTCPQELPVRRGMVGRVATRPTLPTRALICTPEASFSSWQIRAPRVAELQSATIQQLNGQTRGLIRGLDIAETFPVVAIGALADVTRISSGRIGMAPPQTVRSSLMEGRQLNAQTDPLVRAPHRSSLCFGGLQRSQR